MRYLRATSLGLRSGPRLSATISRFCSAVHERLGSAQSQNLNPSATSAPMTTRTSALSVRNQFRRCHIHPGTGSYIARATPDVADATLTTSLALGHDRHKRRHRITRQGRFTQRCRLARLLGLMPPAKQLLWMELPPPRHIRYPHAGNQRLRNDLRLLRRRPGSPAARSGQQLNPPETTLRVVRNFVHKDKRSPACHTSKYFHASYGRTVSGHRLRPTSSRS